MSRGWNSNCQVLEMTDQETDLWGAYLNTEKLVSSKSSFEIISANGLNFEYDHNQFQK